MRRIDMDSAIRRVRDVRLALAALLVLSMTANLALVMSFAGRETVTVLVPATAGPAWEIGGGGVAAMAPVAGSARWRRPHWPAGGAVR